MPGRKCFFFLIAPLALSFPLLVPDRVLAYVGPGAGVELIPYFLGLLTWAGMACGAVLLWPVMAALRRLRGAKAGEELENKVTTVQVSPGEGQN